jgi:SAM-dependent methyltransferase
VALPSALESRALLSHAETEGWWFRAKEDIVQSLLRPHLGERTSALILGAGGGSTAQRIRRSWPRCRVAGLDIDPGAVALCAAQDPAGQYRVADLEHDELAEPQTVDVVFALDVLEHLQNDLDVVARVERCLLPGGLLVVNVPSHPWLFGPHDHHLGHRRRYRPADIEGLLRRSGMQIVHSTPLFATTLLVLALWRRGLQPALRLRQRESDVGYRAPRPVESILYAIARLEGWVARVGLPFGSSHFVLARKGAAAGVTPAAAAPAG